MNWKTLFGGFIFFLALGWVHAQNEVVLSGYVTDGETEESLIGVSLLFPELTYGVISNDYGFFSASLPRGKNTLTLQYMGYKTLQLELDLTEDTRMNFSLEAAVENLDEVILTENVEQLSIRNPQMSLNALSINTIKSIPAVLGEVDIIKSITLLPGVTNGGEGASGFNVRGGAADQNLILLDEAIIFNASHLFGFFSVFNPDATKDLKLYKGGIPAQYGGRVASVLNIYQKEGNRNGFHGSGGVGLISSRLLLEGPLKKGKGSFLVGGRSSYAHLFLPLVESIDNNTVFFYDLNTKLSYQIDPDNSVYLSGYFGRDITEINNLFENAYGNAVMIFRWNHLFSNQLFSNLSMIYSDYNYGLDFSFADFGWTSGIDNFNLKYDFKNYVSDRFKLDFGLNSIYYKFDPGRIAPNTAGSSVEARKLNNKFAFENALYSSASLSLSSKINLTAGLRLSTFLRLGQPLNEYANDEALVYNPLIKIYEKGTPIGVKVTPKSEVLSSFWNLEPRLAMSYSLSPLNSFKLSYNRMAQYLHLISNTNAPTPLDIWAPSGPFVKPQLLDQFAVGYFQTTADDRYSIELEAFTKRVQNRLDYVDGAELIGNDAIEQIVLNGSARAKGVELLVRKNKGKMTGWLAYTLSRSEQRTPGRTATEVGINNGNWYPTPYDKTHDLALVGNYSLNSRWSLNTNFIFQTGQPITFPNAQYFYSGFSIPNYEARNSNRLKPYHRWDISMVHQPKKKVKGWSGEWVFGVYNVYNRQNPASVRFSQNEDTGLNEAIQLSIFGIIPSVTYNFKF
jgi:hypothetical protein